MLRHDPRMPDLAVSKQPGLRSARVAMASFHINRAPFYVMVILLPLGADWSWPQAAGALVVAVGVLLAQRP